MDLAPLVFIAVGMAVASYVIPSRVQRFAAGRNNFAIRLPSGGVVSIDPNEHLPPRQTNELLAKFIQAATAGDRTGVQAAVAESHAASEQARRLQTQS